MNFHLLQKPCNQTNGLEFFGSHSIQHVILKRLEMYCGQPFSLLFLFFNSVQVVLFIYDERIYPDVKTYPLRFTSLNK